MAKQAIITKTIPATSRTGTRIKATCADGSVTVGFDHEFSEATNHYHAAQALCRKLDRPDPLYSGELPDGRGFAFL